MTDTVLATEVRLLEGPNLYFTQPALKVMLSMPGYLDAPTGQLKEIAERLGMRARVGSPGSVQRQAVLGRVARHVVRLIARAGGASRVGVRVRPGSGPVAQRVGDRPVLGSEPRIPPRLRIRVPGATAEAERPR